MQSGTWVSFGRETYQNIVMKSIWVILLMLYGCAPAYAQLWPVSWLGQTGSRYIDTGMDFLDINSSVQMAGMADIGVVASGEYADAGLAQNPALLLDADQAIAGYVAWNRWLSAGLHGFRLDGAFLMPIEINHPLQNTFRMALAYAI